MQEGDRNGELLSFLSVTTPNVREAIYIALRSKRVVMIYVYASFPILLERFAYRRMWDAPRPKGGNDMYILII